MNNFVSVKDARNFWSEWVNICLPNSNKTYNKLSEKEKKEYQNKHFITEKVFSDKDGNEVMRWHLNTDWTWDIEYKDKKFSCSYPVDYTVGKAEDSSNCDCLTVEIKFDKPDNIRSLDFNIKIYGDQIQVYKNQIEEIDYQLKHWYNRFTAPGLRKQKRWLKQSIKVLKEGILEIATGAGGY